MWQILSGSRLGPSLTSFFYSPHKPFVKKFVALAFSNLEYNFCFHQPFFYCYYYILKKYIFLMDEYHLWYFVSFDLICGTNFRLLILFFSMFDKVSVLLGPAIMGTKKIC